MLKLQTIVMSVVLLAVIFCLHLLSNKVAVLQDRTIQTQADSDISQARIYYLERTVLTLNGSCD